MSEKDEMKSFVQEIISEIKTMKELTDGEKDKLVEVVEEAWDVEQE